ncbi:3-hydroxyacyl-CoA dehydrogenase [Actinacidiphila alni]|uniref:3-hydroxyacyl-CoA dehydrogenase n=1 Tax=Actinacidiphila alni TaxID=380248 RepID=UPI003453AA79
MTALDRSSTVAVVGAGTMGQGIAQVALLAGHRVLLHDAVPGLAAKAAAGVGARLARLAEKGRLDAAEHRAALGRLVAADGIADLAPAALVVEAVVEDLEIKRRLFAELEETVGDGCLLATNTSSLSVTAVAGALRLPGRLVGLHFFNPAPLLPLVEVVAGAASDPAAVDTAYDTAADWGKSPVRCADTPGFIVNRIARPFYAEALRLHEERAADPATIDAVLCESGGFAMGPFALTDLIGQDVNEAVTRSVWEAFFHDPKFAPSLAQRRLVESGRLGRKTGRGWFAYGDGVAGGASGGAPGGAPGAADASVPHTAEPADRPRRVTVGDLGPAEALRNMLRKTGIEIVEDAGVDCFELSDGTSLRLADGGLEPGIQFDLAADYTTATRIALARTPEVPDAALAEATGLFQALGKQVSVIRPVPGMIVTRTVAMLVDLAADAVGRGVASAADIDTAMRLGVNYPLGPLQWGERLSLSRVRETLESLHAFYPNGRYAPSLEVQWRAWAEEE